jgi:hypothetical protein
MMWAGHVARIRRVEVFTGFWWGNLRERDHLEDQGIDGRIILTILIILIILLIILTMPIIIIIIIINA